MTENQYNNILHDICENSRDIFYQTGIHLTQYQVEVIMKSKGIYEKYKAEILKDLRKKKFKKLKN